MKKYLSILTLFICSICIGQKACPPKGDRPKEESQSLLKNRQWFPNKKKAKAYDLSILMKDGITDTGAIYVEAYITSAKISGKEACQCHLDDPATKDYHIFIAAKKGDVLGTHNQVIEVSRYSRKLDPSLTFAYVKSLVGHKVRIYGYTFMDTEHQNVIGSAHQWRKGVQEIHPVMGLQQLD